LSFIAGSSVATIGSDINTIESHRNHKQADNDNKKTNGLFVDPKLDINQSNAGGSQLT